MAAATAGQKVLFCCDVATSARRRLGASIVGHDELEIEAEKKKEREMSSEAAGGGAARSSNNVFSRLLRLSPLARQSSTEKPPPPLTNAEIEAKQQQQQPDIYYGVFVPPSDAKLEEDEETIHVYKDKKQALEVVKKYKKSRFKTFKHHQEAVAFALQGPDVYQERDTNVSANNSAGLFTFDSPQSPVGNSFLNGEKPSQFKGPKPQEMVQFRKLVESGDLDSVKKTVWENPRYLVSSGDTPSILQEGPRYNALHFAVKSKNVEMCNFILATVSDPLFAQLLYGDDNIESCKDRAEILLDLYLNTPDKAINETPLHFAAKFGAKDVVDLLASYPQCNRTQTNKFGEQPKDIICQRADKDPQSIEEIGAMLQERFYVPVLHTEDNSKQPVIGEPFSPGSPLILNNDPISPRLEIRAYAGPMNKSDAITFRKKWKTPPRNGGGVVRPPIAAPKFRLQDIEKGLEKVGRDLAQQLKIGWREYWPFLDTFTDIASAEGLGLLEDFLKNKFTSQWNSSSTESFSSSLQLSPKTPTEKNPVSNKNAKPFFAKNNSLEGLSPISDLCAAFKSLGVTDDNRHKPATSNGLYRKKFELKSSDVDVEETIINSFTNPGLNPYLCIEKSCQVFAKRLNAFLASADCNTDQLKTEIKHLQQTIASYMDDPRFHTVDFHLIHCRVAQIVAEKLLGDESIADDLSVLKLLLKDISQLDLGCKKCDSFSSDEEDNGHGAYRSLATKSAEKERKKRDSNVRRQIECLAKSILKWLNEDRSDSSNVSKVLRTEDECIDAWSNMTKCSCLWQTEQFLRNCRKNSSMKRSQLKASREGMDILSSSPKSATESVVKKLFFDHDADSPKNHDRNSNNVANLKMNLDTSSDSIDYDSDGDLYLTPSSQLSSDDELSDFEDADGLPGVGGQRNLQSVDIFIHGSKPTKTDKTVYDAIKACDVDGTKHPYVYRWRHTIQLYTHDERESWPADDPSSSIDDLDSPIICTFNLGHISTFGSSTPSAAAQKTIRNIFSVNLDDGSVLNPIQLLAASPAKHNLKDQTGGGSSSPNMQTSKWLRVTGPNSPRSALFNKNYGPNISLRF